MEPKVIRYPPLNHPVPSRYQRLRENMEMAMPCPKKEVFLAKLTRVNLRRPLLWVVQRKKNQLL